MIRTPEKKGLNYLLLIIFNAYKILRKISDIIRVKKKLQKRENRVGLDK